MQDTFGAAFGRLIKRKRAEMRMTQAQLACALYPNLPPEEAEKRKGDISKLENGKVPNPITQTIKRLSDALGITEDDLEALHRRVQLSPSEQLSNLTALDRDQLELLSSRFEIENPHALSDRDLRDMLTKCAEDFRALRKEINDLKGLSKRLDNLHGAAMAALDNFEIEEAEELLSNAREIVTEQLREPLEINAQLMEAQAAAALLRGKVRHAYDLLCAAADSFAIIDRSAQQHLRIYKYSKMLFDRASRYGGAGFRCALQIVEPVVTDELRTSTPKAWADAKNWLGLAHNERSQTCTGAKSSFHSEMSHSAYRAALKVYTRDDHPVDWAMTQNNLAVALKNQATRTEGEDSTRLLAQAVNAYRAALEVRTRDDHPVDWAMTQFNLALAELSLADQDATEDPTPHLNAALDHVVAALTVYDPEHMSFNHAKATRLRDLIQSALDALN
ncbi:MAG: hypothetical protein GKR98_07745 [Boseongicola sp.]|nr:MAG: hypothetical protein GKR98_07745 [Boseongicola sp.]